MPPSAQAPARPRNAFSTIRRLLTYFAPHKTFVCLIILGVVLNVIGNIYGTYLLKPLINDYITPLIGTPNPDFTRLKSFIFAMAAVFAIAAAAVLLYRRLMVEVSTQIILTLRRTLFDAMELLPISWHDSHPHGETMSLYTNDIEAMREMISETIPEFTASIIRIVGIFSMMLFLSPLLTGITVVMLVVMLVIIKFLGKRSVAYFRRRQQAISKINGYIEEMVEGQQVIKAFTREATAQREFAALNREMYESDAGAFTFSSIIFPIMGNLSQVLFILTAVGGGLAAINFGLDIGTIAAMLQYSRALGMPISHIAQQINSILSALAGAERIFALLDLQAEQDQGKVTLVLARRQADRLLELVDADSNMYPSATDSCSENTSSKDEKAVWAWKCPDPTGTSFILKEVRGEVIFSDVSFSYDARQKVLEGISLYATPGQRIAFVGSTGAGKTTITNLLNRFYDIDYGTITYDGIPIGEISKASLRRSLAVVLQDTHLFTGTVMENIRYGNANASDAQVIQASKLANAHGFISHLTEGYQTVLTCDGSNLSQGQRQLLAIARAAVAAPPVLVLDEATSSVDTRTEALIEQGMDKLMRGRTVFVIAHRLSTVRNSDAIMVLEHGKIIERGNHEDLIALNQRYAQLYNGHFELS